MEIPILDLQEKQNTTMIVAMIIAIMNRMSFWFLNIALVSDM